VIPHPDIKFVHVGEMVRIEIETMQMAFPGMSRAHCIGLLEGNYRERLKCLADLFKAEFPYGAGPE
jgi:hypothetical protein